MSSFVRGLKSGAQVGGQWVDSFATTRRVKQDQENADRTHSLAQQRLKMQKEQSDRAHKLAKEKHDLEVRSAESELAQEEAFQQTFQGLMSPSENGGLGSSPITSKESADRESTSGGLGGATARSKQTEREEPASGSGGLASARASLIENESGGNWQAKNDAEGHGGSKGHFGRLQFGQARMQDYMNATGEKFDPDQFMQDPELQQRVEQWHFNDIDGFIRDQGLDQAIGEKVGGVTMTQDGMRAMAHLGGRGGLKRYIETNGQYNPKDREGTRLSDYAQKHGAAHAQDGKSATLADAKVPSPTSKGQAHQSGERGQGLARAQAKAKPDPVDRLATSKEFGGTGYTPRIPALRGKSIREMGDLVVKLEAQSVQDERYGELAKQVKQEALRAHEAAFEGDIDSLEGAYAYERHMGRGHRMLGTNREPGEVFDRAVEMRTNKAEMDKQTWLAEKARIDASDKERDLYGRTSDDVLKALSNGQFDRAQKIAASVGIRTEDYERVHEGTEREDIEFTVYGSDGKGKRMTGRQFAQQDGYYREYLNEEQELDRRLKRLNVDGKEVANREKKLKLYKTFADQVFGKGEYYPEDMASLGITMEVNGLEPSADIQPLMVEAKRINEALERSVSSPKGILDHAKQANKAALSYLGAVAVPSSANWKKAGHEWSKFFNPDAKFRVMTPGLAIASSGFSNSDEAEMKRRFGLPLAGLRSSGAIKDKRDMIDASLMLGAMQRSGRDYKPADAQAVTGFALSAGIDPETVSDVVDYAETKNRREKRKGRDRLVVSPDNFRDILAEMLGE